MLTEWPPERFSQPFIQRPVATILADLEWLICSPVLLDAAANPELEHWFDNEFCAEVWKRCSNDISALQQCSLEQLCGRPPGKAGVSELLGTLCGYAGFTPRTKRLGEYFEWLVCLWLHIDPAFTLIAKNIPIRLDDGSTLGELDFIVRDEQRGKVIHLEVAVKFYLYCADALDGQTDWHWRWFGPMQKDRLDLKYATMQWRQMRLSEHPAVQRQLKARGIQVDEFKGLLKGRLYAAQNSGAELSCLISSGAISGQWLSWSQYQQQDIKSQRQAKYDWLNPLEQGGQPLQQEDLKFGPQQVLLGGVPTFIVPDNHWMEEARVSAQTDRAALQIVYQNAVYELDYQGQKYSFQIGDTIPDLPDCTIITAYNPGHIRPSEAQNQSRNNSLSAQLRQSGYTLLAALGRSLDGAHIELSFAVLGASVGELKPLAAVYAQRAMVCVSQGKVSLVWV